MGRHLQNQIDHDRNYQFPDILRALETSINDRGVDDSFVKPTSDPINLKASSNTAAATSSSSSSSSSAVESTGSIVDNIGTSMDPAMEIVTDEAVVDEEDLFGSDSDSGDEEVMESSQDIGASGVSTLITSNTSQESLGALVEMEDVQNEKENAD